IASRCYALLCILLFFSINATPTTEIYTLSLHDALPIWKHRLSALYFERRTKMKLNSLVNRIKDETIKRSPEILVAAGIASMISATVFAIQDAPKVTKLLKDKEETKKAPLETEEKVKIIVPGYLRTIVASGIGVACIVGASSIHLHRNAVLTAAYTMSETALKNYTKKAEEIVGKEKADEIREKAQADAQLAVPQPVKAKSNDIVIIDEDCIKCYDSLTGRYFPSNKN